MLSNLLLDVENIHPQCVLTTEQSSKGAGMQCQEIHSNQRLKTSDLRIMLSSIHLAKYIGGLSQAQVVEKMR